VLADAGVALLAVAAAAAGDVEGHRAEVALLDELDARTDLDDLAGDLVAEDEALGRGRAAGTMCWSEPQMLVETTLRIAPCRTWRPTFAGLTPGPSLSSNSGYGISSTDTFIGPW